MVALRAATLGAVALKAIWTESSPRSSLTSFELFRYLDYCSELLAHVGKLGAL